MHVYENRTPDSTTHGEGVDAFNAMNSRFLLNKMLVRLPVALDWNRMNKRKTSSSIQDIGV